jgi:hypothetical protein
MSTTVMNTSGLYTFGSGSFTNNESVISFHFVGVSGSVFVARKTSYDPTAVKVAVEDLGTLTPVSTPITANGVFLVQHTQNSTMYFSAVVPPSGSITAYYTI